ncbi:MAG: DMT family transporter, partial [Spirochaetaceae bacterium]|nr:DMT family transporter [Spirochaetaceae bacterium]
MASALLALLAVAVWSSLAFLGSRVNALPPFLSVGIALVVGGAVGLVRAKEWRVAPTTFAIGVGGIFGYHALLFAAFKLAPVVEANLLNYLWPLLIVVLSPLYLRGLRLSARHVAGASLGLAGSALVVSGGKLGLDLANLPGYLLAAAAAFVWASYSLLTKRVAPFPTGAVGGFCLASGFLSLLVYGAGLAATGSA